MEIREVNINEIYPYENNPRNNENAVQAVMNSIAEFGIKQPLVIDENHVIVVGHTRYIAAKKLGYKTLPCLIASDLSDEQIRAYRLADNKTNELAEWDSKALQAELDALYESFDMEKFGFAIQIENIDLKGELEESEEKFARELDEANNYLVLEFFTESEWDKAIEIFGLERTATPDKNPNIRRYGIGRVIDGRPWLEKLEELEDDDEH